MGENQKSVKQQNQGRNEKDDEDRKHLRHLLLNKHKRMHHL